jgi:hypothetical protein
MMLHRRIFFQFIIVMIVIGFSYNATRSLPPQILLPAARFPATIAMDKHHQLVTFITLLPFNTFSLLASH